MVDGIMVPKVFAVDSFTLTMNTFAIEYFFIAIMLHQGGICVKFLIFMCMCTGSMFHNHKKIDHIPLSPRDLNDVQ